MKNFALGFTTALSIISVSLNVIAIYIISQLIDPLEIITETLKQLF